MMTGSSVVSNGFDVKMVDAAVKKHRAKKGALIAVLQEIQNRCGYVPRQAIERVSLKTGVPVSEIFGIITFYAQFRLVPQGKNLIKICHGTACHLNGAEQIGDAVCKCVGAREGETSPDNLYSVEKVACLGCCSLAPTMMINDETYGRLTPDNVSKIIVDYHASKSTAAGEAIK
jgi:NADH:ubiquinone oxidoreductase subunit E